MEEERKDNYVDRRAAVRVACKTPLIFKVCREETISKIMEGYTQDVSKDGLRCTIGSTVPVGCTLWLKLDTDALMLCEELERRVVILQHGVLGKVIWIEKLKDDTFDIGLQFLTRKERTQ